MNSIMGSRIAGSVSILTVALVGLAGCGRQEEPRAPVQSDEPAPPAAAASESAAARSYPTHVYFGDEHVHTGWSMDAGLSLTVKTPEDAVRFARGEEVTNNTGQKVRLAHPYDWIAVTDHSDGMGVFAELVAGNPEMMADKTAKRWKEMMGGSPEDASAARKEAINAQATGTVPKVIMDPKWMVSAWEKTVDIMEKYNDPGKFTAFISYEWTSNGENGQNLHRNVIFRDNADKTRATPPLTTFASSDPRYKGTDPRSLWNWLEQWEAKTGGRVLAIPHNGNLSNGWMFQEKQYDGSPMTREWTQTRQRWERLFELFQYKGQSEAHPRLSLNDEFADFAVWDHGDLNGNAKKPGMINTEYVREALKSGLRIENQLGANPFKYGMAGGSDTHTGLTTPGEDNFGGKFPANEPKTDRWKQLFRVYTDGSKLMDWALQSSGLTAVWATENTRAALWDAMERRETYATSGPRMTVRLFGGYGFADADSQGDVAATGYAKGVPMGGDLKSAPAGKAPTFLIAAMKDPSGANLDRVQIVKGWVDKDGKTHEQIYDVAWSDNRKPRADGKLPPVGNTVDVATATYANSIGAAELRGVFRDPDFDATQRAFYYARVIEIPTPRWPAYDAVRFKVKMDREVLMVQQERAVTSPIWYEP